MMANPMAPITLTGSFARAAIRTMHQPMTQITPASSYWRNSKLNVHDSLMTVSSSRISHNPRVNKKRDRPGFRWP
jgi:hypothetical protein